MFRAVFLICIAAVSVHGAQARENLPEDKVKITEKTEQRLSELGYLKKDGERFKDLIARFQQERGIPRTGKIDKKTEVQLGIDQEQFQNLLEKQESERNTLFAASAGRRFVIVNIPAYQLTAYDIQGHPVLESNVIIGKPTRRTPLLSTKIVSIKLNPTWSPPPTILKQDVFNGGRINLHYAKEHGLIAVNEKGEHIDLAELSDMKSFMQSGLRLYQPSGDSNALGRLKFELVNTPDVYMHDTNQHSLFKRESRALSSGCVRVERYMELAEWVLGTPKETIRKMIDKGDTRYLPVKEPVDVYVVYWPVVKVGEEVRSFEDPYRQI